MTPIQVTALLVWRLHIVGLYIGTLTRPGKKGRVWGTSLSLSRYCVDIAPEFAFCRELGRRFKYLEGDATAIPLFLSRHDGG